MASQGTLSSAYKQVDVETASQGKLIILLFNGAIQRAEEAKRMMVQKRIDIQGIHNVLIRTQDIISELRSALNMSAGEVAENLDKSYGYLHHLLVQANMTKDPAVIDECVELMTSLRDTWEELFDKIAQESYVAIERPAINPHGASVLNIRS